MTQTHFRNFGSVTSFFAKKTCFIILLPLDKILRFFVLLFKNVKLIYTHTHRRALLSCWTTLVTL